MFGITSKCAGYVVASLMVISLWVAGNPIGAVAKEAQAAAVEQESSYLIGRNDVLNIYVC
jgi:hypothetical protein